MSKRRERGSQRLNRELLDRARRQAAAIEGEDAEAQDEPEAAETPETSVEAASDVSPTPRQSSSGEGLTRRPSTAKRLRARNETVRRKSLTAYEIADLLHNPTKTVSEEELHAQYGFVLADLRSMGLLAAASFGVLLLLAFILPSGV
ncbi:MAG: hypothetical protein MUF38_14670 [Anaerolineae bacterium]|jgi:hypothetical protein|nr:hypothetical protein [Anaerolineae bacterium]